MQDCIFCKIINNKIPSFKVFEDEDFLAFLDINPISKGHTLLITKEHHKNLEELPEYVLQKAVKKAKELLKALKERLLVDFVSLHIVGVDVPHFHIHLIPRKLTEGSIDFSKTLKYEDGEAENILNLIKNKI